ncbi:hypothetical protein B9Z55_027740 [Caenorhabditis nigoni]|nr:hypothetical protein B9Z55_027740 [Caenorhabditis nigoni]
MENIIKFSDFKSVLTLRQVSKDFLNFIDSLNDSTLPDSEFSRIDMIVNEDICLRYRDSNNIQNEFIYSQMDILRSFNGKITFLGSSSVIDVAIRDLELVLKFQKSNLRLLHFHLGPSFETFPVKLSNMFKKLNRKIKTENLSMKADSQSKIMPILPFVEPRTLERIDLLTLNDNMEIEINEIVKTEQWKNADKFNCDFNVSNFNIKDICHFSETLIQFLSVSAKEMDLLRKILIDSSKLSGIWLRLKNFNEHRELSNLWGPCFIGENSRLWYFRMKNSEEEIMEFELRRNSGNFTWRIKIIHIGGVPNGAAVHDYEEN